MKLSFRLTALMLSIFMLLALCGCGEYSSSLERVLKEERIVFGIAPDALPMSAESADGPAGLSVDIGNEIAARLDVEAEYIFIAPENALQYINDRIIDCYINLPAPDIRTLAQIETVDALMDYRQVAVVTRWSPVDQLIDLSGERVCLVSGTDAAEAFSQAEMLKASTGEIVWCENYDEIMFELTGSTCAAAIVDEPQFLYSAGDSRSKFIVVEQPVASGDCVFAFGYREEGLAERIGSIYSNMNADGTLSSIKAEWLG